MSLKGAVRLMAMTRSHTASVVSSAGEKSSFHRRAGADADAIADQFVAIASYAALQGRPLSEERVRETVELLLWGIAPTAR